MFDGLVASIVSSGVGTFAQWMGKKKDATDEAQAKANSAKLAAETIHLEELTAVQKQQLEMAARAALHERLVWACSPFNEGCAKALQTFAQESSRTFVRLLALLEPGATHTTQLDNVINETVGVMLDAFGVALPYMRDSTRQKFSVYLTAAARCASLLRSDSTAKPNAQDTKSLATAYFELLPELTESVHPVQLYGLLKSAADKVSADQVKEQVPTMTTTGKQ